MTPTDAADRVSPRPVLDRGTQVDERLFELAADDEIGVLFQQIVSIEPGVESVKADQRLRVGPAHPLCQLSAQSQCGMHRHRERDQSRCVDVVIRQHVDGGVHNTRRIAMLPQIGVREGEIERLVAEFVARDEQNGSGALQFASPSTLDLVLASSYRRWPCVLRLMAISGGSSLTSDR